MKFLSFVGLVAIMFFDHCRAEANLHGCDAAGFCPCTSSNASECHECFECYKDVRETLQAQMVRFYELKASVDVFEASLPNGSFEAELNRVQHKLDWLDMDIARANNLSDYLMKQIDDIEKIFTDVETKLEKIAEYLRMANESAHSAAEKAEMISVLVNETQTKLREAYSKLTMASNRLADAETARDTIIGIASNISALATEAESEADRQYSEAMRINETAMMAYDVAADAKRKADKALERSREDKSRLEDLMMEIEERRGNLVNVEANVAAAEAAASTAYANAMELYERAALPRPDTGLMAAIERLNAAQMDTGKLAAMLTELNSRFAGVVLDINETRAQADEKIAEVDDAMTRAGELKSRAMDAWEKAQQALSDANKTISDAEYMLNILVNFSQIINETQTSAAAALRTIGMIEALVNETVANASKILEDHQQALMDAQMAFNISCDAMDVAQMALEEIRNCTKELEDLKATVMGLVTEAEAEKSRARELNATAEALKNDCDEIQKNATEKVEEVKDAIKEQENCTQSIEETRDRINDLNSRIANLQRLDPAAVDQLRVDLDEFQNRLDALDLTNMIEMLETQRDSLQIELDQNDNMIADMENDLKSLELIVGTQSQGCVFVGA